MLITTLSFRFQIKLQQNFTHFFRSRIGVRYNTLLLSNLFVPKRKFLQKIKFFSNSLTKNSRYFFEDKKKLNKYIFSFSCGLYLFFFSEVRSRKQHCPKFIGSFLFYLRAFKQNWFEIFFALPNNTNADTEIGPNCVYTVDILAEIVESE
jgi:hypothetical protein